MVRAIDDSETYTKSILDSSDEKPRELNWEQEIAVQLMSRCGLRANGVTKRKIGKGMSS